MRSPERWTRTPSWSSFAYLAAATRTSRRCLRNDSRRVAGTGGRARGGRVQGARNRAHLGQPRGCPRGTVAIVSAMLTNRSAPPVTVTPVLVYPDVRAAVAWLESAFGCEERVRSGETHRAQLRVGLDGAIVVADVASERVAPDGGGWTHLVKVRVADVDAA